MSSKKLVRRKIEEMTINRRMHLLDASMAIIRSNGEEPDFRMVGEPLSYFETDVAEYAMRILCNVSSR